MAAPPPPPPLATGIIVTAILTGAVNDYTSITFIKNAQNVTFNLKAAITNVTYVAGTPPGGITAAAALALLNACTYALPATPPNPITLALVKNILSFSGQPGGFLVQEPGQLPSPGGPPSL